MILVYSILLLVFCVAVNIIPFGLMNYSAGRAKDKPLFAWVSIVFYLIACLTMLGAPFAFLMYLEGKYAFDFILAIIIGVLSVLPIHVFFHYKYVKQRKLKRHDWQRFLAGLTSMFALMCTMIAPLTMYYWMTGTPLSGSSPNYNIGLILLILGGGFGSGMAFFVYDLICRKFQIPSDPDEPNS